ncbi:MAG: septum formation initiator family protein [Rhodospirillaceae bacterium]|nr:septum formation initiator family protein [Rhodospirillaceae bacterium]MCY4236818.1 septum formation initiator family protein [Rhodospirillaceae bacterium]
MKVIILPMIAALCLSYLGFHTIQGDRGLRAWALLKNRQIDAQEQLNTTRRKHDWLVHKVGLMRPGQSDPDMLDEAFRRQLYLGRKDEIVIRYRKPLPIK